MPIWSVYGGREIEVFEEDEDGNIFLCLVSSGRLNDLSLTETDRGRCLWHYGNSFEGMIESIFLLTWSSLSGFVFESPIALSRGFLEERSPGMGSFSERASSASAFDTDQDFESRPWRGTFYVSHTEKVIFSQEVKFKTAELPHWKPHVTIDLHRLERMNE